MIRKRMPASRLRIVDTPRYDNIYHVLSGSKTFTLISPIEGLWLDRESALYTWPKG